MEIINALQGLFETADFFTTMRKLGIKEIGRGLFDVVIVSPGAQNRRPLSGKQTQAEQSIELKLYSLAGEGKTAQEKWFESAAKICSEIAKNPTLGGLAIDSRVTEQVLESEVYEPFAAGSINLTVIFRFMDIEGG